MENESSEKQILSGGLKIARKKLLSMLAVLCFLLEKDYLKPFELGMMSLGNFVLVYNPPAAKNKEIENENLNEVWTSNNSNIKQMCQKNGWAQGS